MKHFVLLEINSDSDSPMIGIIDNVTDNKQGANSFKERFIIAINEHFDLDEFNYDKIPDIFSNEPYYDIVIEENGFTHEIRIMESWVY